MSLRWKLFLSYLAVIAVTLIILTIAVSSIAPVRFSDDVRMMGQRREGLSTPLNQSPGQDPPSGQGQGQGQGGGPNPSRAGLTMMAQIMNDMAVELNTSMRRSVNMALLLAGLTAIVAAAAVSLFISQLIVRPIEDVSAASKHIAAGHYGERLPVGANDELGDLTQNFNRMAEALDQTEAMRQQLMGDVSHELKTPLASIKGYMEGLQDGVIPATPETYQLIHEEASRMNRLVHDLQELSRAQAEQLQLYPAAQDANALAEAATTWLQPQYEDKGITLTLEPLATPATVQADFDRTRQVLLNLLGNALQYTPPGGQVTLRLRRHNQMVQFAISDTGVGLQPADLERIFQRFYRVDKSRARTSGGSGIGLTIARHIVEAQGGSLTATSPGPDQGSTFTFTLPVV
ncbi:sensor histidine kinase [Chloroflexota bacterium]